MPKKQKNFLTKQERKAHERDFELGLTNWSAPFEPWVIRSWEQASKANGWDKMADRVRTNVLEAAKIANDPNLTHQQKIQKLGQLKDTL